ncbi:pilin N-terminal domain-containing protein [Enterococcus sp. AZ007]|uniref:pilin N-terminal domain-containing protein n=1 Tax=Enterococcus sp. AZ007 TaxID=2774839 RepID=UPI003F215BD4
MKKIFLLFLVLLLGTCSLGSIARATEKQVDLWIHTWSEDGKKIEGTEQLDFDVYDLTKWRTNRKGDEKQDKEFLLNTYSTKEELQSFVKQEQLVKLNQTPYPADGSGNVSFSVPRYHEEQDAAYLILANGETGKYHMLPIILYLPQTHPETKDEAQRLLIYGKYQDITQEPEKSEESTVPEPENTLKNPGMEKGLSSSSKAYPATNDLVRDYTVLGLILMSIGFIGFKTIKERKKQGG